MISYLFTVVLSAFLLFIVQPLIGKVILPWFGGTAGVWSVVLLFFQLLLLLGYVYSFLISAYLDRRKQIYVHSIVLFVSLIYLWLGLVGDRVPLLPSTHLRPASDTSAMIRILIILGSSVGIPYFVLSTTGPLLQAWYATEDPNRMPYWLYALSNAGSFLALLTYPFLIEPLLPVSEQAWLWSVVYGVFVLSVGYVVFHHIHEKVNASDATFIHKTPGKKHAAKKQVTASRKHTTKRKVRGNLWERSTLSVEEREFLNRLGKAAQWLILSMCTSLLLAAVTNKITQDVAPVPLLWVIPLGLYLLSYVISFGFKASYTRLSLPFLGVATLATVYALSQGNRLSILNQIIIYTIALFFACLACHGEIARLQPDPQLLTAYYLILAMGGVLGTVLVSVVAPLVFNSYWEFNLGFMLCWAILILILYLDPQSILHKQRRNIALYLLLLPLVSLSLFTWQYIRTFQSTTVLSSRNFYGALRLQDQSNLAGWDPFYILSHGTTIHGMQFKSSDLRKVPIAYFSVKSGVGRLLTELNTDPQGKRVGVLGLGVGTLAAYGREQDVYRFYEIDPDVTNLAEGKDGYFTYLSNASAEIEIVLGDARLSLENEWVMGKAQAYDVLVLDVFSGDAIPVHLLTKECFTLYLDHLAPNGVIAAHISTSHINLTPLLAKVAESFNLSAVLIEDDGAGYPCCASRWVLMSRTPDALSLPGVAEVSHTLDKPETKVRLWTDDYSNPLQVMY